MNVKVTFQVQVYIEILNHKMYFEDLLWDRILMQYMVLGRSSRQCRWQEGEETREIGYKSLIFPQRVIDSWMYF